jgi:hypothetical protein
MLDPAKDIEKVIPGVVQDDGKVYEEILITVRDQSKITTSLLKSMNLIIMFYPLLASIYSKMIWDCRTFTQPTQRSQLRA